MKYAAVFPGQGSQSKGMLSELAAAFPVVKQTFDQASSVLGYDLWSLVEHNPDEKLNQTEYTQPAMLAADISVWRIWQGLGMSAPACLAGHSLGEYSALVAAEAIDFKVAIKMVALRGRLMQEAVPAGQGAMAAILGLEDEQVRALCRNAAQDSNGIVEAVNFNAPGQVVIAGHAAAVRLAIQLAEQAGAMRAIWLPVSAPSHSSLMRDAALRLRDALRAVELGRPVIPVLHNVDAKSRNTPQDILMALTDQLHRPVLWSDTIRALAAQGVTHVVELGPGKVLTGLCRRIDKTLQAAAVEDSKGLEKAKILLEG